MNSTAAKVAAARALAPCPAEFGGTLRCISYLAPSLPYGLFGVITDYLAASLNVPASIEYETRFSAPPSLASDPFALNQADLGFVCSSAVAISQQVGCGFELLGCAPLFSDPRAAGQPVYFSDVVVQRDSPVSSLEDLKGLVWAYNDSSSLTGYYCMLQFLRDHGYGRDFWGQLRASGSHLGSLDLVLSGEADAAAIDSIVLALQRSQRPRLDSQLRIIASWGPFPIQPVIVRKALPESLKASLRQALFSIGGTPQMRRNLEPFLLRGFGPVDDAAYAELSLQDLTAGRNVRSEGEAGRPRLRGLTEQVGVQPA